MQLQEKNNSGLGMTWVGPHKIYSDKSKFSKRELVGGSNPIWKILVNLDHFPGDGGENQKNENTTPS